MNDAGARSTQSGADGHLFLSSDGAREEKIRDVVAGDEEDEGNGTVEDEERTANIADNLFQKRKDAEGESAIGRVNFRMLLTKAGGDGVHFGLGLVNGDAGLEARDDVVVFMVAIIGGRGGQGERNDDFSKLGTAACGNDSWASEKSWVRMPTTVRGLPLAKNVGITPVTAGPGAIGQESGGGLARGNLVRE